MFKGRNVMMLMLTRLWFQRRGYGNGMGTAGNAEEGDPQQEKLGEAAKIDGVQRKSMVNIWLTYG